MKKIAIILGAGSSQRCGFDKLFTEKFGERIIFKTCKIFQACEKIDEIFLVLSKKNKSQIDETDIKKRFSKISKILEGGDSRFLSLKKTLETFGNSENCQIMVHNGANPNLKNKDLEQGIVLAEKKKNVIFGFFTKDSIKKVENGKVVEFLNRDEIFQTQTPQISDLKTFQKALKKVDFLENKIRDEAELLRSIGEEIFVYECCPSNQKITFETDFNVGKNNNLRIGIGEDSHRFAEKFYSNCPVVLGGISFPESKNSFEANSDGDVIFHSICNAILSAVGEKTLDDFADKMCKEGIMNSQKYVERALEIAKEKFPNFAFQNLVISLECKFPKLVPKHDEIVKNCARVLGIEKNKVGLTYTSGEGLSDFGKGLGVRCLVEGVFKI